MVPITAKRTAQKVAEKCGIATSSVVDNLHDRCGDTGAPQALIMLINTLQNASPGQTILVLGFGQGCDAILFETTEEVVRGGRFRSVQAELDKGLSDNSYTRFISYNGAIDMDWGIRAERDTRTAISAFYRNRRTFTGFVGGKCSACGTVQFPLTHLCVNPDCNKPDTQVEESFRNKVGVVKSYTEDWLGHSVSPPFVYGSVRFDGGAALMMEFTDFGQGELRAGTPVAMSFRIKDKDTLRDFRRYFWKAVPAHLIDSSGGNKE